MQELLSFPKISGSHGGKGVTDFSSREKEENVRTNIHIVLNIFLRVLLRTVPKPFAFGAE